MEFVGQVVFGAVLVGLATAVLAIPGLALGGVIGLLLRHVAGPSRRAAAHGVAVWLVLCVAVTAAPILQTETSARVGALDSLGGALVVWIGLSSAVAGGVALHRVMLRDGRAG